MIHSSVVSCIGRTPLVYLNNLFPHPDIKVIAKLEFLNPGGSAKDRPARYIIEQGLKEGTINKDMHIIESSSGNMGIALAMVTRVYGLRFTCVVDPRIPTVNLRILQQYGAIIEMVRERDQEGGYQQTRVKRVKEILQNQTNSLWINQYANQLNSLAHYHGTGSEIIADLDGPVDCLITAVSSTGTLLGVSRRLREEFPNLRVVAVDAIGSVIFGGSQGKSQLPGIGSSRVPELLRREEIDDVIYVRDEEAAQGCRNLLTFEAIFAGGSSGSSVAAIRKLFPTFPPNYRILTIFPDRGERYLDMIYDDKWVKDLTALPTETPPEPDAQEGK